MRRWYAGAWMREDIARRLEAMIPMRDAGAVTRESRGRLNMRSKTQCVRPFAEYLRHSAEGLGRTILKERPIYQARYVRLCGVIFRSPKKREF